MSKQGDELSSKRSDGSDRSHRLRPSGGYRTMRSFQVATIIFDATVSFCARFLDKRSRTVDQMVQAARSGRQNLAEGSRASATSSQTELFLVNVARASLEELLLDYEDYLRQHGWRQWGKNDSEARAVRAVGKDRSDRSDRTDPASVYAHWLKHDDASVVANALLCLIHQANYLIDQQIAGLERDFVTGGGYTEQLAAARLAERRKQAGPSSAATPLPCPQCGKLMVLRRARQGPRAGSQFWGCSAYPQCQGTRQLDG